MFTESRSWCDAAAGAWLNGLMRAVERFFRVVTDGSSTCYKGSVYYLYTE